MGDRSVHVVAACDDGYAPHLAVALLSVFAHSRSRPVRAYVLVPDNFGQQTRLREALGEFAGQVAVIAVTTRDFPPLPAKSHLTVATYYRVLAADLLPPDLERVIYFDCDMIARSDIGELWDTPMRGNVVAAVADPAFEHHRVLGIAKDEAYFNCGMLMIDLKSWRREAIGEKVFDIVRLHPERLTWAEQCALNIVLRDRWLMLDETWNLQSARLGQWADGDFQFHQPVPPPAAAARIVHFNAPARPWLYLMDHPFKREYQDLLARTPWRNQRPPDFSPRNVIRRYLRRHFPAAYLALRRMNDRTRSATETIRRF